MQIEELVAALRKIAEDPEYRAGTEAHIDADKLLLDYIDNPIVTKLYESIPRWYE